MSYYYLPQHLRACFLYVGGFPEDREIKVSKLIRLGIAEQFVKGRSNKRLELVAEEYLQELIDRSLILTGRRRANGRMKTCKIHNLLRQLCLSEAHTENVVHIMNTNVSEAIDDQRRVILLSYLQQKHNYGITSITRTFISMQSLYLYFPEGISSIVSQFKLLKVLDVLSFDYDFSCVIPQLVHLRYVAARIKGALSLEKLRNLETLILQTNNRVLEDPLDIWTMPEIRYLDIDLTTICHPLLAEKHSIGEKPLFLNNLHTLGLHHSSFVAEILRRTPHLKKLTICDDSEYVKWPDILGSLNLLEDLETLEIEAEATIDWMIFCGDIFPPNLKQLTLFGSMSTSWEDVKFLANLPNLEVLKGLFAFDGTDWKLDEDVVFRKLKYLGIKYVDLKRWEATSDNFPMLEKLVLHELKQLEEIPESIGEIMTLK